MKFTNFTFILIISIYFTSFAKIFKEFNTKINLFVGFTIIIIIIDYYFFETIRLLYWNLKLNNLN
jgi:hypothetical protein